MDIEAVEVESLHPDSDCEKADECMIPRKTFPEEHEDGNKLFQIMAALAVCYICICGGNISGFTSSAIPSMRQVSYKMDRICFGADGNDNMTAIDFADETTTLRTNESGGGGCVDVLVENFDSLQNITDSQASWIGGLAPLGAFFGSFAASISVKLLGPKGSILFLGAPMFFTSWIITALAPNIAAIYAGRFLGGIALGLTISSAPLYIIDTASLSLRGPLGTLTQFLFTLGVLSSFILGSFMSWRELAWASAVLVLPSVLMLCLIPESPVWLLKSNRTQEAERSFYKMRGKSADFKSFLECHLEYHIDENQNTDEEKRSGISFLWKLTRAERKSCLVAVGLCIFQQLSGINGVNYYTLTIFKAASEGSAAFVLDGHISSIIVASVFCLATFPSYILIEKCGRKMLLMSSIAMMVLSSAGLGTYFYFKENVSKIADSEAFRMIPLICLIVFVLAFSSGFGPILYILVAEIISTEVRACFSPWCIGINWLSVFAITKSFSDLIAIFGIHGVFYSYSVLSVIGLIFVAICVPETKGKTEKEIEKFFW